MSKKYGYFLAFCMVSAGFFIMIPGVEAEVGTIITTDTDGAPDHYFRQGDYIYYQIAMPISYAGEQVKITITDEDGTQWHTNFEDLDSNAEYKSWNPSGGQSYDSYYISGSETVGPNWNISVFNASTLELLNWHIFEVYVPSIWTSTIEFFEDALHTKQTTLFPVDSRIYYTVTVVDEHNAPLQWTWVDIFVEHNLDEYNVDDIWLDGEGFGFDYFDINWYWYSTSDQIGDYTMEVQEPLGTPLANTVDFSVYEPIYSATIKTFTGGYTTPTTTFPTDGQVYWSAHIEDQHGRNLPSGREIYLMVEHDGDEERIPSSSWWDYPVDDEGNVSSNFWIGSYWSYDDQIGKYTIRVHDHNTDEQFSGSADFEVIVVKISPEKSIYAQGEEITITVTAEIYQSNINITIYDEDWSIIEDWKDQSMANRIWTINYVLADTLPDGVYYLLVNESETDRPLGEIMFNVKKYTLQILPDAGAYLPGETMTLYYTVTNNKDGSGVSGTTIEWIFEFYDTEDHDWDKKTEPRPNSDPFGSFPILIPELASKSYDGNLRVWANDTNEHSSYSYLNIEIGGITASLSLNDDEYIAGDFVVVDVSAYIDYYYNPLKNGNVHLTVLKEGVEIAAYTVTNLNTDLQGGLKYIFALQDNAEIGMYTVEINVSKENEWDTDQETFEIVEERDMTLELGFDNTYYSDSDYPLYYSGDTVRVTYTALRGEEIVDNVNCEYWVYYEDNYISAGTTSAREFTFTIPADFEGRLSLYVEVTDSESNKASTIPPVYIDVHGPSLLLNPKKPEYLPGDKVKIEYKVVGTQLPDVSYYYEIKDNRGNVIRRADLTQPSGEFQFEVPEADVPDSYSIRGWITDNNGNSIAESSAMVTRLRGYMITFSLDKNTYRPGETATLHYKITSVDDSEIPQDFRLIYGYSGGEQKSTQSSKAEGDLKVMVPEDAADGSGFFYLSSDLPYGSSTANAQQEANIRSNPNPLAETVGDMSFLSLILLILVIIALIFGIGGWRRGKKALEEAKLPPWKKEGPLPEPEKFKEPEEPPIEEPTPPPVEEEPPSPPEDTEPKPPE